MDGSWGKMRAAVAAAAQVALTANSAYGQVPPPLRQWAAGRARAWWEARGDRARARDEL